MTVPLVLVLAVTVGSLGARMWRNSLEGIETTTVMLHELVESTLRSSIESYLRAKVETAKTTIDTINRSVPDGDPAELTGRIADRLLTINIAETGYVYVIDDQGTVVIHPDPGTRGRTIPEVEPVKTQLQQKHGYLEYSWQNSFEPSPRPKALYMEEYEPFDWIVSASSYREEFVQLVDTRRLAQMIQSHSVAAESYSVIVDRSGRFIAHPDHAGRRVDEFFDEEERQRLMDVLFSESKDRLRYSWPEEPGEDGRPKMMFTRHLPDFGWAIATTVYLDSLRRPTLFTLAGGALVLVLTIVVLIVWVLRMSHVVSDPIVRLAEAAQRNEQLSSTGFDRGTPKELITLVDQFNAFVRRIEQQQRQVTAQHENLRRSVEEKTVLVREIHHRVKNNLQVIASLLNLQADGVHDGKDSVLFERTSERVMSMAMVHEQLHHTDDLSLIPFDRYLTDLIEHIRGSSTTDAVDIRVDCEPISLEIHRAVPCGLIVNELVMNALQHAFEKDRAGTIEVYLHRRGERYELGVRDSGAGMPAGVSKSLGMTLVEMLSEQLEATLEVSPGTDTGSGTSITLSFPV